MQEFIDQANHNEELHTILCEKFPGHFFDWKVTVLFYCAVHYLKALAAKRGIKIGKTHVEIAQNCRWDAKGENAMPLTKTAFNNYKALRSYAETARYDGMLCAPDEFEVDRKKDYDHSLQLLGNFKAYVKDQGLTI